MTAPKPNVWWDDGRQPIGKILDCKGNTLKVVMPPRQPLGFEAPKKS